MAERTQRGSWAQRNLRVLVWASICALLGAIVGFVAGGYYACSPSEACEFKADLAGAVGTWVGGLGTIGALVFAVIAFRSEEAARRRDEELRIEDRAAQRAEAAEVRAVEERKRVEAEQMLQQEIERDRASANKIVIDASISSYSGEEILSFAIIVRNRSLNAPIQGLGGVVEGWPPIEYREVLAPGSSYPQVYRLGFGQTRVAIPLPPEDQRDAWRQELIDRVTISFDLNGRRWERRGNDRPELVG